MKKNKRKGKSNKKAVIVTISIFIAIHIFFFTTRLTFPAMPKLIVTGLREEFSLSNNKTVEMIRWDYCAAEHTMEIEMDIHSLSYEKAKYQYYFADEKNHIFSSKIVYSTEKTMIIQAYGIPEKVENITFAYQMITEEKDENNKPISYLVEFNNNIKSATPVKSLKNIKDSEYVLNRLNCDIKYYNQENNNKRKQITDNLSTISDITEEINRLKTELVTQTLDEQEKTQITIENDTSQLDSLKDENNTLTSEIQKNESKITELKKQGGKNE